MSERKDHRLIWVLTGLAALVMVGGLTPLAAQAPVRDLAPGQPLPAGPDAKTERDYRDLGRAWMQTTMLDAYQRIGRKNPAWDKAALDLLEKVIQEATALPAPPQNAQLLAEAQPVLAAGCDDPLVLATVGMTLMDANRTPEAEPLLRRAVEGYQTVKYSRCRAWLAAWKLAEACAAVGGDKAKETDKWQHLAVEWMVAGSTEQDLLRGRQRVFWSGIERALNGSLKPLGAEVLKDLAATPGADPWIVNMVGGLVEQNAAWDARGQGWASDVHEAGWSGFGEHLGQAHKYFTQAYALHPEDPDPAEFLIEVTAMSPGGYPGESARLWFDRAVKAELDAPLAYAAMRNLLLPRWGGSHEASYEFGLTCLATKRFDTKVPMVFLDSLWDITEGDGDQTWWRKPGVYDNLRQMFEGYLADPKNPYDLANCKRLYAVASYLCGDYPTTQKMFQELGDQAEGDLFATHYGLTLTMVKSQVQAATGPLAARVAQAEQAYQGGDVGQAAPLFRQLVKEAPQDGSLSYLRDRAECARLELALQQNGWVEFMPPPDLTGWQNLGGTWSFPAPGTLEIIPGPWVPSAVLCHMRAPENYEIRGEIDLPPKVGGGVILGYQPGAQPDWTTFELVRGSGAVVIEYFNDPDQGGTGGPLQEKNQFVLQVWQGRLTVYVNGVRLYSDRELNKMYSAPVGNLAGIGGMSPETAKQPMTYRNVQMRRLTGPPGPPAFGNL